MTKAELLEQLRPYPDDCLIYVPDFDGTAQTAKAVGVLAHMHTPIGIAIPDDVYIVPWAEGEVPHATES